MTGIEGQVELVGYKAVVAMFLRWTAERRGEDGSGYPIWTLRASLSFQKDSHLLNDKLKKRITVKSPLGHWEATPLEGVKPRIEHETQLVYEGVTLWPVDKARP
jgi:hypothetical protein